MKRRLKSSLIMATMALTLVAMSCRQETAHEHDTYTCPMHPTVVSDKPGTCPVCGMDLVRKARPGEEVTVTGDLARLTKSPNEQVVASIKTVKGRYEKRRVSIEAPGVVTYDTRNSFAIPSRVAGRLENVYVKTMYQRVNKGQRIADVYSPELVEAQRELLFVLENDNADGALVGAAREKLRLLGMTENDIDRLVKTKDVQVTVSIYSPYSGYLVNSPQGEPSTIVNGATSPPPTGDGMGMNGSSQRPAASNIPMPDVDNFKRVGSYVASGEVLFYVTTAQTVRIELKVLSAPTIGRGDTVVLKFGDGHVLTQRVDFVQPFNSPQEQYTTVRITLENASNIRVGEWVTGEIHLKQTEALWIPSQGVLDAGVEKVVFVKDKNVFRPRPVNVGAQSGNDVQIVSGLSSADEIAADAHYLVDSESLVKHE